jgi:DNA-binding HxlR family transcriptional regulator
VAPHRPVDPDVLRVVLRPHLAEVLVALLDGPATEHRLRALVPRRLLADALRGLAALGAVTRGGDAGSWDTTERASSEYVLTDRGRALAAELGKLDVWVAAYESSDAPPGARGPAAP